MMNVSLCLALQFLGLICTGRYPHYLALCLRLLCHTQQSFQPVRHVESA